MNNDNVFILKFITFDNKVQNYCLYEEVEGCIKLDTGHSYVKLIQDMNIGEIKKLEGQEVEVELLYKGKSVKYIPEISSLLNKTIPARNINENELFINITKTNILKQNKIYFYIYYKPTEKYINGSYSYIILNGLKKYPTLDYHNNYQGYFSEFSKLKLLFKDKFINKFNITNDTVFCCVPSHKASSTNNNSIALMIKSLAKECGIYDGSQVLLRYKNIDAQKNVRKRKKETHLNSVKVAKNIENKNIILMDDITTSGSSLLACKQLLMEAGANSVICFAFGKDS